MKRFNVLIGMIIVVGICSMTISAKTIAAEGAIGNCGDSATFIHDIQGAGAASPMDGTAGIVVEGVVVGDFQDTKSGLKGFFIQEEDDDVDADPKTSEGLFINDNGFGADVNVGDKVRVRGTVKEYYDLTELSAITHMMVCGSAPMPTAMTVRLPVPDSNVWEQYEGMAIHITQPLVVTGNYNQGRYGEVDLSVKYRLMAPTNMVSPGAPAIEMNALNDRSRILLDDGSRKINPTPIPYMGPENTLRAGDTINGLKGVVDYAYRSYRIQPTAPVVFKSKNKRMAHPKQVGGKLKVASFNVLNYFNGDGSGGGFPTPRGADTPEEFKRQRGKIIAAITRLNADIVGLMEMENDAPPNSAIEDLIEGLNTASGAGTYDFIRTGVVGTDAIRVALIYKPAVVSPLGGHAILDSKVDPDFIDTKNRPSLAQTFQENGTNARFTVAVNHLKSKGSSCSSAGDPDTGDGQGNCNLTRTRAAKALVKWLETDPTGSGDPDVLIIGDLNAYAKEDPVTAIKDAGYTDLVEKYAGKSAYSYIYYGQAGSLDHALANKSLAGQVTSVTEWHINADEPAALDYNDYNPADLYQSDPFRASDHDPVLIGLSLACNHCTPEAADLAISMTGPKKPVPDELSAYFSLAVSNSGPDKANNVKVINTLPKGFEFVSADTRQGSCTENDNIVTCTVGSVSVGQRVAISIKGRAETKGRFINSAYVVSDTPEPDPSDNHATKPVKIVQGVRLSAPKLVKILRCT